MTGPASASPAGPQHRIRGAAGGRDGRSVSALIHRGGPGTRRRPAAAPASTTPPDRPGARSTGGPPGGTRPLSLAAGVLRFGLGVRRFAREQITLAVAERAIRDGMRARLARLLALIERAIFAQPRSPYLALFRAAGCELGDVRRLVHQEGGEEALRRLHESGVYVSHEEFS